MWMSVVASLFVVSFGLAGQKDVSNSQSWSGVIINSNCTADEAFAEQAKCTEAGPQGTRLSLFDDTQRRVYSLEPQDQAMGRLGDSVSVAGTVQGNAIRVESIKTFPAVGLPAGRKAPAFSARDQFGREQTLETLKGAKGTVLLFFRSADW